MQNIKTNNANIFLVFWKMEKRKLENNQRHQFLFYIRYNLHNSYFVTFVNFVIFGFGAILGVRP